MPPEPGDDSDDDDDLEMGAVTQDFKCPLTLRPLENPVTSSVFSTTLTNFIAELVHREVCGHSFSADAIRAMFGNSKGSKKCPSSGCNRSFTYSECKPNKQLAKKMRLHERRMKKKEQETDADEVIE